MTRGFRDLRSLAERKLGPNHPLSKQFFRSRSTGRMLLGRVLGSYVSAATSNQSVRTFLSVLGVAIRENPNPAPHPRNPGEPASSRLARGLFHNVTKEKLQQRIVGKAIAIGVPPRWGRFLTLASLVASPFYNPKLGRLFTDRGKGGSWSEPKTPAAPEYPYNNAVETESGHIVEMDDTPGAERLHVYHRSGSFVEFHPDGTVVAKHAKHHYHLTLADQFMSVSGNCHISVEGSASIAVNGTLNAEVKGDTNINTKGDMRLYGKNVTLRATHQIKLDAPIVDLKYTVLPTSARIVGATPPTIVPALKGLSIIGGAIRGLSDLLPSVSEPPTLPLSNPAAYAQTTPEAVTMRTRLFDSVDELNDLNLYENHLMACSLLGDFTDAQKIVTGVLSRVDTAVAAAEPSVLTTSFDSFANVFSWAGTTRLGEMFTLGELMPDANGAATVSLTPQRGLLEDEMVYRMHLVAINVLEPLKQQYPDAQVLEGWRPNTTGLSQHETGEAVDITFGSNPSPDEWMSRVAWMRDNLAYDVLQMNFTNIGDGRPWVHVSFTEQDRRRLVQTKDFSDALHDGLVWVEDYDSDTDRQVAVEAAERERTSISTRLQTEQGRRERLEDRIPNEANDSEYTGGSTFESENYIPQWSGLQVYVMGVVDEYIAAYPDEWASVMEDRRFITRVVQRLQADGYNAALNGKRGNVGDISTDAIVFPNDTGCKDASGTHPGLEMYDIFLDVENPDARAAAWTDKTVDTMLGGTVGAWVPV